MSAPLLSLVTGKVGRDESFQRLVDSVIAHTVVDWELVISDASQTPYAPALPNIRVIHENPRLGCAAGYNAAFRQALGEYVIWLNDDAEVMAGYAESAIAFMETHPQIGLGALHYSENAGEFRWNSAWGCGYSNFGIIKRSLGDQVGWFGNLVKMYGCDNVITLEVLLAGYGVADIPNSRVLHHSEKDQTRAENQQHRAHDNLLLSQRYMPLKAQWQATYNKYRMESSIPWSHGMQPRLVRR